MNLLLYSLCSYFVGTIMFGYIIGKVYGKVDIRTVGSGNVGARNIGRTVNKSAFIMTFLGDALKASFIVWIGYAFSIAEPFILLGVFFVLIGHIWPITLRFHGGKGVSSFLGGMIAFDSIVALILIVSFSFIYLFVRNFSKAGLISFIVIPIYCCFASYSYVSIIIVIMAVSLILFAHRK